MLKKWYPVYGGNCGGYIPTKTSIQCNTKARYLKISSPNKTITWTEEEILLLKQYYPQYGPSKCSECITNRTLQQCMGKASELGIRYEKRLWSDSEIQLLYKWYPIEGPECYKRFKNRTKQIIGAKASKLNIKFENKYKKILCVETGEIFKSGNAADKKYHCSCNGALKDPKKTAGGYHWQYVEE